MVTIATSQTKRSLLQGVQSACITIMTAIAKWLPCQHLMLCVCVCVCVCVCSGEVTGTAYMPMRPSEKERSSQTGRNSLSLHFLL